MEFGFRPERVPTSSDAISDVAPEKPAKPTRAKGGKKDTPYTVATKIKTANFALGCMRGHDWRPREVGAWCARCGVIGRAVKS